MLLKALAIARVAGVVGVAACGGPTATCALDDGTAPAEAALIYRDGAGTMHDVVEGGAIPLIAAPQGGHIVLVGARVHDVGTCEVTVNAALRDPATNRVLGLEERPITLAPDPSGWSIPEQAEALASYANVAMCPTVATSTVDGAALQLEVRITGDAGAAPLELMATVTPQCEAFDDFCACECDPTCGFTRRR